MVPKLPVELQLDILDLAIPPLRYDNFRDVHAAARSLALVCWAWARPAQRRLFEAQMIGIQAFSDFNPLTSDAAREIGKLRRGLELAEAHGCETVALRITTSSIGWEDPALAQDSSAVEMVGRRALMVDRVYVLADDPPDAVFAWIAYAMPASRMLDLRPQIDLFGPWIPSTPLPSNIEWLQVHHRSVSLPFPAPTLTHVLLFDLRLALEPAHYPSLRVLAISNFAVNAAFVNSTQYFSRTLKHLGLFDPYWRDFAREENGEHPLCVVLDKVHLSDLATLTIGLSAEDPDIAIIERRLEAARTAGVAVTVLAPKDPEDPNTVDLEGWAAGL